MRFTVTPDWKDNQLLRLVLVWFLVFTALLWVTNALLYFSKMGLTTASVVEYYLGSEERFLSPRSYQGLLEVSHFHLFAMGMLLLVLTHLALFVPVSPGAKAGLVVVPFVAALLDEGAGWLVRFVSPGFAALKIAGFLLLQGSLAALVLASLWAVFTQRQGENYAGGDDWDDEEP